MRKLAMENDSHCDRRPYRVNITKHVTILCSLLQSSPVHKAWNIRSYFTRDRFLDILHSFNTRPHYIPSSERFPYRVNITKHVTILCSLLQSSPVHKAWNIRSYFTRDRFLDILHSFNTRPHYIPSSERFLGSHDNVAMLLCCHDNVAMLLCFHDNMAMLLCHTQMFYIFACISRSVLWVFAAPSEAQSGRNSLSSSLLNKLVSSCTINVNFPKTQKCNCSQFQNFRALYYWMSLHWAKRVLTETVWWRTCLDGSNRVMYPWPWSTLSGESTRTWRLLNFLQPPTPITSRPVIFFREIWFMDCSCMYIYSSLISRHFSCVGLPYAITF